MKGLHVEVTLLAGLFLVMAGLLVMASILGILEDVRVKFIEWGGLILGALLLAIRGRTSKKD